MKIKIIFLAMLFFVNKSYANNEIKLPKQYKIENTFSGKLAEKNSFHLIFTKNTNTKSYEVFTYLFDGNKTQKITSIVSDRPYEISSYFYNDDIISLLLNYKVKKKYFILRIDINTTTKEINKSQELLHKDFMTSLVSKNKAIYIYKNKKEFIVRQYNVAKEVIESKLNIDSANGYIRDFFEDNRARFIDTNEFVANGSTASVRAYYFKEKIFFTKQIDTKTEVLQISLNGGKLVTSKNFVINTTDGGFKKNTSFLFEDKLYQLGINKNLGIIKISNFKNGSELQTISINDALLTHAQTGVDFDGILNFLKQTAKNKYIPTITINETTSGNLLLRIDYVDTSYSYNNWWMYHQMQMQMQMQNAMNSAPHFGPSVTNQNIYDNIVLTNQKHFFQVLIDTTGNVLPMQTFFTKHKEINKKEYTQTIEKIPGFKFVSSCFLKNSFHYIGFFKKTRTFVIKENPLK